MIIHISGVSGSGKTYLGKRLSERFGNKIIVHEFVAPNWNDKGAFQESLDKIIERFKKERKPIILIGMNNKAWWPAVVAGLEKIPLWHRDVYYRVHSDYNFYIDIDVSKLVRQNCLRYLREDLKHVTEDERWMNDLIDNNKRFMRFLMKGLKNECDMKEVGKFSNMWKNAYEHQGYTVATSDEIYDRVVGLVNRVIGKKQKTQKARKKKRRLQTRKTSVKKM
jgi:hypothetical protein